MLMIVIFAPGRFTSPHPRPSLSASNNSPGRGRSPAAARPQLEAPPRARVAQVLHDGMLRELLARIAPHVPLALHQHYPERAPPTASELRQLEAISRLEAINLGGELARCAGAQSKHLARCVSALL